jgi:hypothetical protein
MVAFIYFGTFIIGVFSGIPIFKFSIKRQNLTLLILSIPYMILLLTSLEQYFPKTETLRVSYFWWMMGILLMFAIKEHILKKIRK